MLCSVLLGILSLFVRVNAPSAPRPQYRPSPNWDTFSDTWSATDALGRKLPAYEQVGPPRKDRTVGVFYFLWHGTFDGNGPYDVSQILRKDPLALSNAKSPLWGKIAEPHHWGQSIFGYYVSDDEYVIRKHAQMLSDAGVDVIIFDVSNDFTYKRQYMKLLQVFSEVRSEGGQTPQVAFLCPFWDPGRSVRELYRDLYGPGLYKDLWFQWKGKPLVMADPENIGEHNSGVSRGVPWVVDDGKTVGERFVATKAFESVGGQVCTYLKGDTAMTLTLYRGGFHGQKVASQRFKDVPDNGWMSLRFAKPLPPGAYYLEMTDPKGQIGWWSSNGSMKFGGQILVNGSPEIGHLSLDLSYVLDSGRRLGDFFTFRKPQPSYFEGPTKPNMWSWLEVYPQHVFKSSDGHKEEMSVGVAQNAVGTRLGSLSEPDSHGRNWHAGSNDKESGSVDHGLNFQEQFERALKEDPEFVFITGWNEWIAGRFDEFAGVKNPVMFVDEFNQEYSRDIEPMVGGHGDNYYYQMVSFIRRYKGVRQLPFASPMKSIDIASDFSQWSDVGPQYRDDRGDTAHRDHVGWNSSTWYVNSTGRNDFVSMKVARDKDFVYFYAQTKDPITPHTDPHWMLLFLNVGIDAGPSWLGYQFVLNRVTPDDGTCVLEKSTGGWHWAAKAKVRYRVVGTEMQLAIRRTDLGLGDIAKPLHVEFKWMDNMQHEGDPTDFDLVGDAAPNGRFNYQYIEKSGMR